MFIRPCYRKKNGKRRAYWALVESYRTERGPRQRVVAYLGQLDEKGRLGIKEAARVRVESRRDFGGPWLALEMVRRLGLKDFLDATRVGKLMGRNTRTAGLFHVDVKTEPDGRAKLIWREVEAWRDWAQLSEGCYLLRSNVTDWSAEDLWKAYIQLTEAEAAFRIHKSDLRIRPIWHQKDERVLAHILVCFLAYVLWKMLGGLCRAAGLGSEPRRVLAELGKITAVDVVLPTRSGVEIRKRCVTRPNDHQAILLQRLGLRLPMHLENTTMQ